MPDREAVTYPESFVSDEEQAQAANPFVGDGSPATAPEVNPPSTLLDRVRRALGIY